MINITPSIEKKILNVVRGTDKNLLSVQRDKTPHKYDLKLRCVEKYQYNGKEYVINNNNTKIYRMQNPPFCSNIAHTPTFLYTLKVAIKKRLITPFLLLKSIGGVTKNIDWDNIIIVRNYNFCYLIVDDIEATDDNIDTIIIPNNINYASSVSSKEEYNKLSFAFTSDGLYAKDYTSVAFGITIVSDDISFYEYKFSEISKGFIIDLNAKKKIYSDNIIIYDNNSIVVNNNEYITQISGNTFKFINPEISNHLYIRAFYNNNSNESCELFYRIPNNTLITYARLDLDESAPTFYNNIISNNLELSEDLPDMHDEAVQERFNRIVEYRSDLLYEVGNNTEYNKDNVRCFTLDAAKLLNKSVDNRVTLGLRHWKYEDGTYGDLYRPMIFVNNKLYEDYNSIIYNKNDTFSFRTDKISADDKIEIYYFGQVKNNDSILITVPKDSKKITLSKDFDARNSSIFYTDALINNYFEKVNELNKGMMAYTIQFEAVKTGDNEYMISFEDESMYDKELLLVTNNQFKSYSDYSEDGDNIAITLPADFKYCHNINQYMVFINGERVDTNKLEFAIPNNDNPYYNISIYSSIVLNKGDKVDVFYLPFMTNDVMTTTVISMDGYITINGDDLAFGLNTENYWLFVNGRKVASKDIDIISNTMMRITKDISNTNNVTLMLFGINPTQVEELFRTDRWNKLLESLTEDEIKEMYGITSILTNDGSNILDNETYKSAVLLEMYKDYYGFHYYGEPLVYTGNEELLDICNTDSDGNKLLPVGNANINSTLDLE